LKEKVQTTQTGRGKEGGGFRRTVGQGRRLEKIREQRADRMIKSKWLVVKEGQLTLEEKRIRGTSSNWGRHHSRGGKES